MKLVLKNKFIPVILEGLETEESTIANENISLFKSYVEQMPDSYLHIVLMDAMSKKFVRQYPHLK